MQELLERYAKHGIKLDPGGRVVHEDDKFNKPGLLYAAHGPDLGDLDYDRAKLPENIKRELDRAGELAGAGEPRAGMQTWEETLYGTTADQTAVTGSSETAFVPIFTLPAGYFYAGRLVKWTVFGRQSTAITTPGTITLRLSYSASGVGAVVVVASSAYTGDVSAAATNLTFMAEFWMICRATGTSGTAIGFGRIEWTDYDDVSATTLAAALGLRMAPASAPATATIDTTVARAVSPTYQSSVTTGSMTCHLGYMEALT